MAEDENPARYFLVSHNASEGRKAMGSKADSVRINLMDILKAHGSERFGFADLTGLVPDRLSRFPRGVSFLFRMDPEIMAGLHHGPTPEYAEAYVRTNERIDALADDLAAAVETAGFAAFAVPASKRSDPVGIRGDFPHKTAATRSGLGWIGRHCQLVTREFGPWVRLGTVLTDLPLPAGRPVDRHYCGTCRACVEACPSKALTGAAWSPGVERIHLLDAAVCDEYKKTHFMAFHGGHNCGICASACPFGHKSWRKNQG